jgi:cytidine deaminase
MTDRELIEKAKRARLKAYAPYSNSKVGAALLTASGKVYTGANVENVSYGLTVCAERAAVQKAVNQGDKNFLKIAVVSDRNPPITPCGACRQVLSEFAGNVKIICADLQGKVKTYTLKQLLPQAYKRRSTDKAVNGLNGLNGSENRRIELSTD